jgi:hypothetical protein
VLSFFCHLEADAGFGGEWHGRGGPLPIRRHPRMGEIARRARLSKQTMTTMVRPLERDGSPNSREYR